MIYISILISNDLFVLPSHVIQQCCLNICKRSSRLQGFRMQVRGFRMQVQGFRIQVQGFRMQVQGTVYRASGCRYKVQGFRVRGFRMQVQCTGLQGTVYSVSMIIKSRWDCVCVHWCFPIGALFQSSALHREPIQTRVIRCVFTDSYTGSCVKSLGGRGGVFQASVFLSPFSCGASCSFSTLSS